jgi:hypothetical protein
MYAYHIIDAPYNAFDNIDDNILGLSNTGKRKYCKIEDNSDRVNKGEEEIKLEKRYHM